MTNFILNQQTSRGECLCGLCTTCPHSVWMPEQGSLLHWLGSSELVHTNPYFLSLLHPTTHGNGNKQEKFTQPENPSQYFPEKACSQVLMSFLRPICTPLSTVASLLSYFCDYKKKKGLSVCLYMFRSRGNREMVFIPFILEYFGAIQRIKIRNLSSFSAQAVLKAD